MVRGIDAPQFRVGLALCLEFILSWYVTFPNLFWDNKLAYDKRVKPVLHDQWSPDPKVMKLISDSYSKNIF